MWAYLTIQDLLHRVARGELYSCDPSASDSPGLAARRRRRREVIHYDDDDYEGSGGSNDYYDDYNSQDDGSLETIMDEVGDSDIIICDNLERALFLSLKYEFVTPLTSLVVVKPDNGVEEGEFGDADGPANIRFKIEIEILKFKSILYKNKCTLPPLDLCLEVKMWWPLSAFIASSLC